MGEVDNICIRRWMICVTIANEMLGSSACFFSSIVHDDSGTRGWFAYLSVWRVFMHHRRLCMIGLEEGEMEPRLRIFHPAWFKARVILDRGQSNHFSTQSHQNVSARRFTIHTPLSI